MVFPVVMCGCESWTIKRTRHWRSDAFELWGWRRFFGAPWAARNIQPVHPKGNQSWIFIGRTDAEVEALIRKPPDAKNWLIGKYLDAGKEWRQKEKGTADEMVGWHHWLNGHDFEQSLGAGDGQRSLTSMGSKESDITEWLNNNNKPLEL